MSVTQNPTLKVLLIDDDSDVHLLVKEYLKERLDFTLEAVNTITAGFESIVKQVPDVVLLDLSLTDSHGLKTFDRFQDKKYNVPVVIFTSLDDESAALEAMNKGAQDYLVKGHVNPRMLGQVLRYAVERFRSQEKTRNPQMIDPVTGLYNEQGFLVFAEQYLKSTKRNLNGTEVFLFILEELKQIESEFGMSEAHHALKTTAEILKESFRASDVLARVDHDRFVVVPTTSSPFLSNTVMTRIKNSQIYYNSKFNLYKLFIRWQAVHFPAEETLTIASMNKRIQETFHDYAQKALLKQASAAKETE